MLSSTIIAAGIVSAAYGSFKACKLASSPRASPRSADIRAEPDVNANGEGQAVGAEGAEKCSAADAAAAREAMLTLWVVLALFRGLESWADYLISGLPFYGVLKLAFIVCVMLPHRAATRTFVFAQWVDPTLSRYEQRFTAAMRALRRYACDLIGRAARKALRLALNPAIAYLSAEELTRVSDALSATSKVLKTENTKRLSESVRSLFAAAPAPAPAPTAAPLIAAAPAASPTAQIEGAAPAPAPAMTAAEPGVTGVTPRSALSSIAEDTVAPAPAAAVNVLGEADHSKADPNAAVAVASAAPAAAPQKAMDVKGLLQRVKAGASAPTSAAAAADAEDKENRPDAAPVPVPVRRTRARAVGAGAAAKTTTAAAASRAAKLKRQSIL